MARVALVGLEESAATELGRALKNEHEIQRKPVNTTVDDLADSDIVFADGDRRRYVNLLRGVREKRPAMPFVVVTKRAETSNWLDALEAGATDYCAAPFQDREMRWLVETALHRPRVRGVAA
jgi:DNA-binding NtrC family response regulator